MLSMLMTLTSADTYYVTPTSNTPCLKKEGLPCYTLSWYASKPRNYFSSNTTLILLSGSHSLELELSFQNITFLSIEFRPTSYSDTSVTCYQSAKLTFKNINVVSMRGLVLFGCVNNEIIRVEEFTMENCTLQGQGHNGTGLQLNEVFTGHITRSFFSSNTGKEVSFQKRNQVGGAIIVINSTLGITISNCTFDSNTVTITGDDGGGGAVYVYSSRITIVGSKLNSNSVTGSFGRGGAVYIVSSPITIVNSVLNNNTVTGDNGAGGAVYADNSSHIAIYNSTLNSNTVHVTGDSGAGGAVYATSIPMITIDNCILNNNTVTGGGGAVYVDSSPITIGNSMLNSNTVTGSGGAVYARSSYGIVVVNSMLNSNTVTGYYGNAGGAVCADSSNITLESSTLNNNTVAGYRGLGGAVHADSSRITLGNSTLNNNTVTGDSGGGGAVYAYFSPIVIDNTTLSHNTVTGDNGKGGAVYVESITPITIDSSTLNSNTVNGDGGAVSAFQSRLITIHDSIFSNNNVTGVGSAFYLVAVTLNSSGCLDIKNNIASTSVLYAVGSTLHVSGNTTVSNNYGSLFAYSCNVTFKGYTNIVNNSYHSNTSQEGGALTAFQSEIVFTGGASLMYNWAIRGGGIAATQSKLYMYGDNTVSHNTASVSGGGIYAYQSELNLKENFNISKNRACDRGGGIHAISSTTRLIDGSKTYFVGNNAERGGGMCLESNAKVYLLKTMVECLQLNVLLYFGVHYYNHVCRVKESSWITLHLHNNTAVYGGAVYVADDANSATCDATPFSDKTSISSECFIQSLALYNVINLLHDHGNIHTLNTEFIDNSAAVAGDVLYGGLLDRCGASPFAEVFQKNTNLRPSSLSATSYIVNITDLSMHDFNSTKKISSDPVRVCFCRDNQPDCSYNPLPKYVRKGEAFTVSLVAVDHINNTIAKRTIIHAYISQEDKLGEGQSIQQTSGDGSCTDLVYSIVSPHNSERLRLYAEGPCMSGGISTANLTVNIALCPIGFIDADLHCECDRNLYPEYISNCFIDNETVKRKDNAWFSYVHNIMNTTDHHQGYILHKHCPFDYCHPPTENISVNLNIENGANELCAFNRSGKLCGSCEVGFSLSLGGSRCRPCSNNWLALLIGFAIFGVALVAFLLKLNFTVAVGTFDGLIFYANILVANRAIFFPYDETKMLTIFIAWLNLDFGFETCFYDGMDGYSKTWLQLAFPLYVISLVAAIIIISDYSTKFAHILFWEKPNSNTGNSNSTLLYKAPSYNHCRILIYNITVL